MSRAGMVLVILAFALLPSAARAQTTTNGGAGLGPSQQQAQPLVAVPPPGPTPHLLGDLDGLRPYLDDHGVSISLDYTSETAADVDGGRRTGIDYAHQIVVGLDLDGGKLAGLDGLALHGIILERAGRNASADYIGDPILQAQELYGAGFNVAAHLVYLYLEQTLWGGRLDVAAGRLDVGADFAASPLYCNFMTLAVCGHPRALQSEPGFTDWPQASWGGRVRGRPLPTVYLQLGLYEAKPYPAGGRTGFDWSTTTATGVSLPVELGWEPVFGGSQSLLGHYKAGLIYDTSDYADLLFDSFGAPIALPGATSLATPREDTGRLSLWLLFDQMLMRNGPHQNDGLIVLGAYTHSDPQTSVIRDLYELGLLDRGFWAARPADQFGLNAVYYHTSNRLQQAQELELADDLPLSNNSDGPEVDGMVLEANYNFPVLRGAQLQPELEYWVRPGATTHTPSALVLGLKAHVSF